MGYEDYDEEYEDDSNVSPEEIVKWKKAGAIHAEVRAFAEKIIKKGDKLIDIATKIDNKIYELGAKPAFPVNLSKDSIAAHATPAYNEEGVAEGLLKVDIGIQVDGYVADSAFTLDLENSEEHRKLIKAAQEGLAAALEKIKFGVALGEIGSAVQNKVESHGLKTLVNLTGHQIKRYNLHAGHNIPSYASGQKAQITEGAFAIEPFVTAGAGRARDGKPSGIYMLVAPGNVRDNFAREVLAYIADEYQTLPFASRWIYKKFGGRGLLALSQIERAGILYQYPELIEAGGGKVAQFEHTVVIKKDEKIITTLPKS